MFVAIPTTPVPLAMPPRPVPVPPLEPPAPPAPRAHGDGDRDRDGKTASSASSIDARSLGFIDMKEAPCREARWRMLSYAYGVLCVLRHDLRGIESPRMIRKSSRNRHSPRTSAQRGMAPSSTSPTKSSNGGGYDSHDFHDDAQRFRLHYVSAAVGRCLAVGAWENVFAEPPLHVRMLMDALHDTDCTDGFLVGVRHAHANAQSYGQQDARVREETLHYLHGVVQAGILVSRVNADDAHAPANQINGQLVGLSSRTGDSPKDKGKP